MELMASLDILDGALEAITLTNIEDGQMQIKKLFIRT